MLDLLLLASTAAFVLVGGIVGVRLLRLAARTRELSDFLVGFALLDLAAVAYPLVLYGSVGAASLEGARAATALSTLALAAGWAGVFLFTQRVFRPGEGWAIALSSGGIALLVYGAALGVPYLRAAPDRAALSAVNPATWVEVGAQLAYSWTALEGFRCWTQARRRLRLGLADPLVVNRFLLWGAIGVASLVSTAPSLVITLAGGNGATSVVARFATALGGLAAALALQLAFLPPARYRAFIARTATA